MVDVMMRICSLFSVEILVKKKRKKKFFFFKKIQGGGGAEEKIKNISDRDAGEPS